MLRLAGWQTPKVLGWGTRDRPGPPATLDTPGKWCISQEVQILVAVECKAGYSLEQQPQHTNLGIKEQLCWAGGVSTAPPQTCPLNSKHCTTEVIMYNKRLIHESIFWRAGHPKRVPWTTTHLDKLRYHYGATTALFIGASTPLHAHTSSRGRGVIAATRLNDGSSSDGGCMDSSLGSSNSGGNGKLLVIAVAVVAAAAWWWWWLSS